jgi:uncharacterized protein
MKMKILILLIGVFLGMVFGAYFSSQTVYIYTYEQPQEIVYQPGVELNYSNASFASIKVPAVDQEGNGVTTILSVQVVNGTGKALVNIDKILFWTDTQNSIRTARTVAENITGIDLSKHDIIYTIIANASVVEGSSAGAALTIATIAALENRELNSSITITGTVNHDGTIGPVSEILTKAIAAKSAGMELFLVPLMQSMQVTYKSQKYCEKIGWSEICTIEKIPQRVDVSEQAGIDIKEVETIGDALGYFLI